MRVRARRTRRYAARRKPSRRSPRRPSYRKKRTYRKKTSRKSVLNITSRKKRNGMLSWANTSTTNGGSVTVGPGPAVIRGDIPGLFLWNATAQDLLSTLGGPDSISQQAARTATTCYMRGLSEHLRISTNTGVPWFHRRICFTSKGSFTAAVNPGATQPRQTFVDVAPGGVERLWFNAQINNDNNDVASIFQVVFRGFVGRDWTDPIVAPTDPVRITVKYDKTWTYKSGNQVGTVKETKIWHPMNKNIVYDDDENGDTEESSYISTTSKAGMGNYFVLDIFSALTGAAATDLCRVDANSTLYWHER